MIYTYPCDLNPDEDGGFLVTFPDVPEAITGGKTHAEALEMGKDALTVALAGYVIANWEIPAPSPVSGGQELIPLDPIPATKLALYNAMREQDISEAKLARCLGTTESAVNRLLMPDRYTHITSVMKALRAVGHSVTIQDTDSYQELAATAATTAAPSPDPSLR
ncbi:MAG: type II toxin-antitoxin system HicB family antitoxin [Dehalococcoidia bacterium]|nr:type II toxin-antitoxin system HicB family antitoxin [Dehalococcoidia bacterium]